MGKPVAAVSLESRLGSKSPSPVLPLWKSGVVQFVHREEGVGGSKRFGG